MNQKELNELRRRFRLDKNNFSRVYGCYVNSNKEIIAWVDTSMGLMRQEEQEMYLNLLKKSLSGALGRNLIDIVFSTQQVADSEEHRLLSALRTSELKDAEARDAFYQQVTGSLDMGENNYLILLGADAYDVPHRGKDGEVDRDACEEVFRYFVCCVCPVKDGTPELGYFHGENEFHISMEKQIVGQPELGFLFPAFDDRTANLYNALFYSKDTAQLHQEVIDAVFCIQNAPMSPQEQQNVFTSALTETLEKDCSYDVVFRTEPPMSAAEQRETFQSALCGTLEGACSMEVVQSVHDYLRQRIQEHKESRDPEPLAVTAGEVSGVLRNCGVPEERVEAFQTACGQSFGEGALTPANLIDAKHFAVKTADATIQVDPERSYLVEARIIDGRRYLLVPADESVEVNGLGVRIAAAKDGGETT